MEEKSKKQPKKSEGEISWENFLKMPFSEDKIGEINITVSSNISTKKTVIQSNSSDSKNEEKPSTGRLLLDEFIKKGPDRSKIGQVFVRTSFNNKAIYNEKSQISIFQEYFNQLRSKYRLISKSNEVMNSLEIFSDSQSDIEFILIDNQQNINNYILNDVVESYYYIGFDVTGQIVTKAVLNMNYSKGLNITVLIDRYIIIFKYQVLFDKFLGYRE